jgi:DNA-3-methyladenine glycosylase II
MLRAPGRVVDSGRSMPPTDYTRARRHLATADPVLATAIRQIGPCGLATRAGRPPFETLARSIVSQQLSARAATTIFARVQALLADGRVRPADLLALAETDLRLAGLSSRKIQYVRDLAQRVESGALRLDVLARRSDEEVIDALTEVKGIGQWTAEMFLIFRLRRPDVLPLDDQGLVGAVKKLYRMRTAPTPERLTRLAEPWRPYRSVACWYLWRWMDEMRNGSGKA